MWLFKSRACSSPNSGLLRGAEGGRDCGQSNEVLEIKYLDSYSQFFLSTSQKRFHLHIGSVLTYHNSKLSLFCHPLMQVEGQESLVMLLGFAALYTHSSILRNVNNLEREIMINP